MLHVLFRLWGVVVGIVMIALSLVTQLLIFLIIAGIAIPMALPQLNPGISLAALLVLFNGVSCYEYFRLRRVVTVRDTVGKLAGLVRPNAESASMAFFLVPRGIDRILTGREYAG